MQKRFSLVIIVLVLVLSAGKVSAQNNKIGYISLQELIVAMPEFKKANADMADYQKALQEQANEYQEAYERQDSIFIADSVKWTSAQKQVKRRQLNEAYLKAANFSQQEAPKMLQQREQELLAPIQQKAVQTAQAVGKENGFTYILSKEQLISFPPGDDILPLVAKKLNITLGKPDAATPGTTPPAAPKTPAKQ
jgi:outer membrane protein